MLYKVYTSNITSNELSNNINQQALCLILWGPIHYLQSHKSDLQLLKGCIRKSMFDFEGSKDEMFNKTKPSTKTRLFFIKLTLPVTSFVY